MSTRKNILTPLKTGFIGLLFVLSNYAFATNYYVDATAGSDSNSGTAEAQAWKTLSKVRSISSRLSPGDVIALKKGSTFKEILSLSGINGTSGNPIIFTSYGTGNKPVISAFGVISGTWTSQGNNKWSLSASTTRLWKDGVEQKSIGRKSKSQAWAEFGKGAEFAFDTKLYVYSTTNPSNFTFEGTVRGNPITLSNSSYIVIDGLDLVGGIKGMKINSCSYITVKHNNIGAKAGAGIETGGTNHHLMIENNVFDSKWTVFYSHADFPTTYAGVDNRGSNEGIQVYGSMTDSEIRYNDFKNWGHAGIALTSFGSTKPIANNKIHHNFITSPDISYGRAIGYSGNGTYNNEFYRNYISDTTVRSQMNGKNNHIHHNWFENIRDTELKDKEQGQAIGLENYNGNPTGNVFEYNSFKNIDAAGIDLIASGTASKDISSNTFRKNLFDNCGASSYYPKASRKGINVQNYVDVRANNFSNNAFLNGNGIYHRGKAVTPDEFNSRDGVQGDDISGNTATVSDQGAGNRNEHNIGSGATQTVQPVQMPSTPPPAVPTVPETGAFIMDRSGLR